MDLGLNKLLFDLFYSEQIDKSSGEASSKLRTQQTSSMDVADVSDLFRDQGLGASDFHTLEPSLVIILCFGMYKALANVIPGRRYPITDRWI